jgi:hypothetical protein
MTVVVLTEVWEVPGKVGSGFSGRGAATGDVGASSCSCRVAIRVLLLVGCPTCFFLFYFTPHPPTICVHYVSLTVPLNLMFALSSSKLPLLSTYNVLSPCYYCNQLCDFIKLFHYVS